MADHAEDLGLQDGHPETVPAISGDGRWRVLLNPGPDGISAVVTLPLDTVDGATSKLLWLNAVLLGVTIVALIALGRWVVRLGLLPLTRMERTAQDITAGRLDLRLADTDARTEVGRLGRVLNSMLDRLQKALLAREASEARLRRFVADAGHELRTPLTAIQGYAQLALRPEPRSALERHEANRFIAQNAERMSLLVDDLQLLATLDKEPSYRRERVDLLSLAADAVGAAAVHSESHPSTSARCTPRPIPPGPRSSTSRREVRRRPAPIASDRGEPALQRPHPHPPGTRVHVRVGTTEAGPGTGGTDRPGRTTASPPLSEGLPISVIEVSDEGPGLEDPSTPSSSSSASTEPTPPAPASTAAAASAWPSPRPSPRATAAASNSTRPPAAAAPSAWFCPQPTSARNPADPARTGVRPLQRRIDRNAGTPTGTCRRQRHVWAAVRTAQGDTRL